MSQTSNSKAMEDAELWFARLRSPECKAAERLEFQRWSALPQNAAAFTATKKLWEALGSVSEHPQLAELSQDVLRQTAQKPLLQWMRLAAGIAFVLVAGGLFWALQRGGPVTYSTYETAASERSTLTLADGSVVTLNFGTRITARLDRESRHITLRKGEALFVVTPDPQRPFKVTAADGEITVLGTRFQVRHESQQVAVTLLDGSVAVHRADRRVQLKPGDQLRFLETSPDLIKSSVDPDVISSWSTGRLLFRATPLAEAMIEVNRYAGIKVRIADPSLETIPISGTFQVGDSASVVSALEALLPVEASRQGDTYRLGRRDREPVAR